MSYDVLIIGSGLSGLAAGIRLAHFDKKVCIVEKHIEVGGLNSFYVRKNRTFDVGLHAMTNYSPKGVRSSPLGKLLKQLRFRHEDFQLCPQQVSEIRFPEKSLCFSNDFELLKQEVADKFPRQIDGFLKLVQKIEAFDELSLDGDTQTSALQVLNSYVSDPLLIDMLCCPIMYYGNARERDMDFYQFVIMFKSIFVEGFAKPLKGMRFLLSLLVEKYKKLGGELRLGAEVESINAEDGRVQSVTLKGGECIAADTVISSMGSVETFRRCKPSQPMEQEWPVGQLSFMESIFVLDREPKDLGYDKSIVFFNTQPKFDYRVPDQLIDVTSGVLCCPNNFNYPEHMAEGMLRLTNLASAELWKAPARKEYVQAKKECRAEALRALYTFFPDFSDSVVFLDTFTPRTIQKYTGHLNGAVYGSPRKIKNGMTPVKNLFLCGTDQGFLGIVGATLSGISMANFHVLQRALET
jgi:phytoene dehydrogenase-like protein